MKIEFSLYICCKLDFKSNFFFIVYLLKSPSVIEPKNFLFLSITSKFFISKLDSLIKAFNRLINLYNVF